MTLETAILWHVTYIRREADHGKKLIRKLGDQVSGAIIMLQKTRQFIIMGFCIIAFIFSISTVLSPWWKITTTREEEIRGNGKIISAEYGLTRTVTASMTVQNQTIFVAVPFENMSNNAEVIGALNTLCTITLTVSSVALFLNILTIALVIFLLFVGKKRFLPFIKYTAAASALLFLVATAYFASEAQPGIAKLESVLPQEMYVLAGSKISSFWGGINLTPGFYEWIWGPALGWFSAFVSFLINGFIPLVLKRAPLIKT